MKAATHIHLILELSKYKPAITGRHRLGSLYGYSFFKMNVHSDIIDPSEVQTGINTPSMPGILFCSAPMTDQPTQTGK